MFTNSTEKRFDVSKNDKKSANLREPQKKKIPCKDFIRQMINSIERNRKRTGRLIKELSKTYEFYGFELKSNKREQCQ